MNKKILILTAGNKGGHYSASLAIVRALKELDPSLEIINYDSNHLFLGYHGDGGEQGYITLTTKFRAFWKVFFEFTSFFKGMSNYFLGHAIQRNFKRLLKKENPDLILSLHPCFVGCALKRAKKFNKNLPFYVAVLDPIKHSHLWRDKRVDLTFLPTKETKEAFLKDGFKEDQILQCGFPISLKEGERKLNPKRKKLLFVNPSQKGVRTTKKLIEVALKFDVDIDVVTGSDEKLKKYLEKKLPHDEKLRIFGYVNDMHERLLTSDILLTKAGPNMMFEAVAAHTPVIITGHLLGQEEKNGDYIVNRGYGYIAEKPNILEKVLKKLLIENPDELEEISKREACCEDLDGARNIAKTIIRNLEK